MYDCEYSWDLKETRAHFEDSNRIYCQCVKQDRHREPTLESSQARVFGGEGKGVSETYRIFTNFTKGAIVEDEELDGMLHDTLNLE